MRNSIFSDDEVAKVKQRNDNRKATRVWSDPMAREATKDMDDVLAELDRTSLMVETVQENFRTYRDAMEKLFQSLSRR
jgi:hypothetical protein